MLKYNIHKKCNNIQSKNWIIHWLSSWGQKQFQGMLGMEVQVWNKYSCFIYKAFEISDSSFKI